MSSRYYWALLELHFCYFKTVLQVYTVTDRALHMILRWNTEEASLLVAWPERRGIPHKTVDYIYPRQWKAIGQLEPGNTLTHTFIWPNWKPSTTQYMIFTGAYRNQMQESQSGPYHYRSPPSWYMALVYNEQWSS